MPGNFYTVTIFDVATWPTPNYTNPVERLWLPIYAIVWQVASTLLVTGRLYLRLRGRAGLDDALLFTSWAFSVAFTASACILVWNYDIGRHIWDVRPDRYEGALYWAWVAQVMFIFSTGAIKTSVLLFYRRMAKDYSRGWRYTVWFLLVITIGTWIAVFIAYCFMCQPLSVYWEIHKVEALGGNYTCLDGDALTISTSVLTIASDIWTVALPCIMFQYHDLGVSKRQKIALNIIFSLGFLVTGGGIARTYYLWLVGHNEDLSWIGYNLFAASIAECQLAIMCTCAPFLRAFFRRHMPTIRQMTKTSRTDTRTDTTIDQASSHVNFSRPMISAPSGFKHLFEKDDVIELDANPDQDRRGLLVVEDGLARVVWNQHGATPNRDSSWI